MLLRSHGGGNCSGDGGAHEGGPDLHPTAPPVYEVPAIRVNTSKSTYAFTSVILDTQSEYRRIHILT